MTSNNPISLDSDEEQDDSLIIESVITKKSRKLSPFQIDIDEDLNFKRAKPNSDCVQVTGVPNDLDTQISSEDDLSILESITDAKTDKTTEPTYLRIPHESPIRLIECDSFNKTANKDTVSLYDLVGDTNITATYQFNLLIDFNFLMEYIKASSDTEIYLINSNDGKEEEVGVNSNSRTFYKRICVVDVKMKQRYTSHHSKMMVNFYKDKTVEIIIHTMNIIPSDYRAQTQMAWRSPRLQKIINFDDEKPNDFKRSYLDYLGKYEANEILKLKKLLIEYDFSPIQAEFIGFAPGDYELDFDEDQSNPELTKIQYGYGRLYQLFKRFDLSKRIENGEKNFTKRKYITQISSIASPYEKDKNIFLNILLPIMSGKPNWPIEKYIDNEKEEPIIIWPTFKEVTNALYGHISGHALHFDISDYPNKWGNYNNNNNNNNNNRISKADQYKQLKKYLYTWGNPNCNLMNKSFRSLLSPHCKTYCSTDDNFNTLNWFILTSANMSKQAWGYPRKKKGQKFDQKDKIHYYKGASYEVGILLHPKCFNENSDNLNLIPVIARDTLHPSVKIRKDKEYVPIRLPYDLPLHKYTSNDEPWTKDAHMRVVDTIPKHNPALMDILAD